MKTPGTKALQRFAEDHDLVGVQELKAGKAMLRSADQSRLVKVGMTALGRHLVRRELRGWELLAPLLREHFAVGHLEVMVDDQDLVAFGVDRLEGKPARSLFARHPKISPCLALAPKTMSLKELLEREETSPELSQKLLSRHGNQELPTTPSHGDYIYWNLFVNGSQPPGLIDFEYASAARVAGWDDLHFRLAPWWLRALRRSLPMRPLLTLANMMSGKVKPDAVPRKLFVDLFFVHWAATRRSLAAACEAQDPCRTAYLQAAQKAEALL